MDKEPNVRIAYADDDELVREGVISLLTGLGGISVAILAIHGRDLIEQLERAAVLPEVIMLDISMEEMDGFETIMVIKDQWPEVKVLVLTGHDNDILAIRMISLGANGYLLKAVVPRK